MNSEEITLAEWVSKNQNIQKSVLLDAVLKAYPEFRQQFFDGYDLEENEDELPIVSSSDGLSNLLTLQEIIVHQINNGGAPYVG